MSLLDLTVALLWAVHDNDTTATARLLGLLEARLSPGDYLRLLEAILGDQPRSLRLAPHRRPMLANCA